MILKMTLKLMLVLAIVLPVAPVFAEETPVLKTMKEKVSYGIGVDMSRSFKRQGISVDVDLVIKGLKDGLSGEKLLMPEEDIRAILVEFQSELSRRQALLWAS